MAILKKLQKRKRDNTKKQLKLNRNVQFGTTNRDGESVTGVEKYRKDGTLRKIVSKTKRKNKVNNLRKVEKFDKKGKKRKEVNYFRGKRNTKKM